MVQTNLPQTIKAKSASSFEWFYRCEVRTNKEFGESGLQEWQQSKSCQIGIVWQQTFLISKPFLGLKLSARVNSSYSSKRIDQIWILDPLLLPSTLLAF